jgi:hypothetical protein
MPGYSYAPYGAGAAYMGMMGHLGSMRESRGGPGFGAASYGMYGGGYGGGKWCSTSTSSKQLTLSPGDGGRRVPRSGTVPHATTK